MLEFQLTDDSPLIREGITCFKCDSTVTVTPLDPETDFCFCEFECEEPLLQFAGTTEREKDYFMLYYKSEDEDLEVKYFINDTEIIDDSLGKAINNGYEVDFTKVYNVLGGGDYTLKMEIKEWGVDIVQSWGLFKVAPFNQQRADGTFKIESFQTGNIEKNFNFENENVRFSLRIPGILTNKKEVYELLDTPDGNNRDVQVHDRWWNEYDLIFDSNKYNFVKLMLNNMVFGTEVFISDYSLFNQHKKEPFNRLPLRIVETESERTIGTNTTEYTIKFRDSLRNGIKHPYIKDC